MQIVRRTGATGWCSEPLVVIDGEPAHIAEVGEFLATADASMAIEVTGLRHGDKLAEHVKDTTDAVCRLTPLPSRVPVGLLASGSRTGTESIPETRLIAANFVTGNDWPREIDASMDL